MHLLEWTGQSSSEINNYSVNEIIWKKDALGMFNIGSEHLDFVLVLTGVCLFVCLFCYYLFFLIIEGVCGERKGEKLSNFRGKRTDNAEVETLARSFSSERQSTT